MSKTLFVGDIHTKQFIIDKVEKLIEEDKDIEEVIFVGDYVDDWLATEQDNIDILNRIFELKDKYQDKITLLIGNHEMSYLGFPCSGHIHSEKVSEILKKNLSKLEVLKRTEDYLVSHAGVTQYWLSSMYSALNVDDMDLLINRINFGLKNNDYGILQLLSKASESSGGIGLLASCLWARPKDHRLTPLLSYTQIMGHTPISGPILKDSYFSDSGSLIFIDTFSTYYNTKEPIGKQELLVLEKEKGMYTI